MSLFLRESAKGAKEGRNWETEGQKVVNEPIKLLDVVALVVDLPDRSLVRGQVGTVVEELAPGVYEVEFSDSQSGQAYAMAALREDQLLPLRHAPVAAG
jgi:hypothetical protein